MQIIEHGQIENKIIEIRKQKVIIDSDEAEFVLVKNFDRFNKLKHSTVKPKEFTERGLYY